MGEGRATDDTEAWLRLARRTGSPTGMSPDDMSEWLRELDESAVARVLDSYLSEAHRSRSLVDVAASTGIEIERLRMFWQALGFVRIADEAPELTVEDVELITTFVSFFADRTREQGVGLQMARVLGSNLDRVANAQVDTLVARVLLTGPAVDVAAERSRQFDELMPRLLELIWRRQLVDATHRRRARSTVGDTTTMCVGFADMVGFTATSQELNQLELARVVGWFEAEAYAIVTAGDGRVVKTIGDEVMFVADDVRSGASIAVELAQRFNDDPRLPDVHVGLTNGPVLLRRGDVYGPTVNLASRIVSVALPGTVLVTEELHDLLADDPTFDFRASFELDLDDIGAVTLWRVRRPGSSGVASRALDDVDDTWRQQLDGDAVRQVTRADDEAVERLRRIEADAMRDIAAAKAEARERVAAALRAAREQTDAVDADARRAVAGLLDPGR